MVVLGVGVASKDHKVSHYARRAACSSPLVDPLLKLRRVGVRVERRTRRLGRALTPTLRWRLLLGHKWGVSNMQDTNLHETRKCLGTLGMP